MTKIVFVCFSILVALGTYQVDAQYGGLGSSPSGLQGLINGMINICSENTNNAFETSIQSLGWMRILFQSAHQMISNNPFTEISSAFQETGLFASLKLMKTVYTDAVPPLLDTLQAREERIADLSTECKRVHTQVSRTVREMKSVGTRCFTPIMANDMINEIYTCTMLPVNNVVVEMTTAQVEVRKAFDQLNWYLTRRRGCMSQNAMQAVPCAQTLINEIPMLIEGISRGFSIPVSVHSYMEAINQCLFTMRERMKVMCPM